jgi:hypothetical protein
MSEALKKDTNAWTEHAFLHGAICGSLPTNIIFVHAWKHSKLDQVLQNDTCHATVLRRLVRGLQCHC